MGEYCYDYEHLGGVRERIVQELQIPNPIKILDFGTGDGIFAIEFAKRFPEAEIVAVEYVKEYLESAERNIKEQVPKNNIELIAGDLFELDFEGERFDVVASFLGVCHLSKMDLERFLRTAREILKLKGLLVIADRNPEDAENEAQKLCFEVETNEFDYGYFSREEIQEALERNDFSLREIKFYKTGVQKMDLEKAKKNFEDEIKCCKAAGIKTKTVEELVEKYGGRIEKHGLEVDAKITLFVAEKV